MFSRTEILKHDITADRCLLFCVTSYLQVVVSNCKKNKKYQLITKDKMYAPCFSRRSGSKKYITCIGSQQNITMSKRKIKKFAQDMREEDVSFSYNAYLKWRKIESLSNQRAQPHVIDLTLETTPLSSELKNMITKYTSQRMSDDRISSKVLFVDTPEAVVGFYEEQTVTYLDKHCPTNLHKDHKLRYHPMAEKLRSGQFVSLYFRKHLVTACVDQNTKQLVILNPASRTFCDIPSQGSTENEARRKFYERMYKSLARKIFQSNKVVIRHLNVQKKNDCSIWVSLLPILYHNKNLLTFNVPDPQAIFTAFINNL